MAQIFPFEPYMCAHVYTIHIILWFLGHRKVFGQEKVWTNKWKRAWESDFSNFCVPGMFWLAGSEGKKLEKFLQYRIEM